MNYLTIKNTASFKFEEKKSIFIGHVKRAETEEEAKAFIQEIKSRYRDARHNCYAYIIGENMGVQRYSDDGEPQGTAGIPILEIIKKNGITDAVVVVTRYFGGILLGTGGLVRAYSKATTMAIKEGNIVLKVMGVPLYITVSYELIGKLQYIFENKKWFIENMEYTDKVRILINSELTILEEIKTAVTEASSGNCTLETGKENYYFKLGDRLFLR